MKAGKKLVISGSGTTRIPPEQLTFSLAGAAPAASTLSHGGRERGLEVRRGADVGPLAGKAARAGGPGERLPTAREGRVAEIEGALPGIVSG